MVSMFALSVVDRGLKVVMNKSLKIVDRDNIILIIMDFNQKS